MKKIVITGGHLTPALAVIKTLLKENNWQILFIGRKYSMEGDRGLSAEARVIPQMGVKFVSIQAGRIPRTTTRYSFLALLKIPLGFFQAFYHLWRFRPCLILSFGGYLAVPVVLAGWLMKIPIITHEQSLQPGLANRLIAFFAKRIAVSWQESLKYFPQRKVVFTGNPLREEILKIRPLSSKFRRLPIIYITGGNQGAHVINRVVGECLEKLLEKYQIFHQCGTVDYYHDYQSLKKISSQLKPALQKRYQLKRWFSSKEVARILSLSSLVVCRAGINTLFELMFLGKPAILIPFPFLKEQRLNAQRLAQIGLVEVLPQSKLSCQKLFNLIDQMIQNLAHYRKQAQKAKILVRTDATQKLIAEIKKCVP